MKKVEAIIKPFKLDEVKTALSCGGGAGDDGHRSAGFWEAERP